MIGDNFVSALDALNVINFLAKPAFSQGEGEQWGPITDRPTSPNDSLNEHIFLRREVGNQTARAMKLTSSNLDQFYKRIRINDTAIEQAGCVPTNSAESLTGPDSDELVMENLLDELCGDVLTGPT